MSTRTSTRPSIACYGCSSAVAPNLCVIGDPDQAIYGFHGADRRYFLQFEQDYPGAVTLSLSRNYRSSQRILDAAGPGDRAATPIASRSRSWRSLRTRSSSTSTHAPTDRAEAESVVHQIEGMVGGTSHFSLDSARG